MKKYTCISDVGDDFEEWNYATDYTNNYSTTNSRWCQRCFFKFKNNNASSIFTPYVSGIFTEMLTNKKWLYVKIFIKWNPPFGEAMPRDWKMAVLCTLSKNMLGVTLLITSSKAIVYIVLERAKCWNFIIPLHQLFIDLKLAYEGINSVNLWTALKSLGLPVNW